jgi:hypothetical protein
MIDLKSQAFGVLQLGLRNDQHVGKLIVGSQQSVLLQITNNSLIPGSEVKLYKSNSDS